MTGPARYRFGPLIDRATRAPARPSGPSSRPLWIYTLDPSQSRLDGAHERIRVPYESLEPGPVGLRFEVDAYDHVARMRNRAADLDDSARLIDSGHRPSPTDPCFHQQMVYAVACRVHETFRTALGRDLCWGFRRRPNDPHDRLRLVPHAFDASNAVYDNERGEIRFGYFHTRPGGVGPTRQHAYVFTCLSHDVIAHEVTHALLDGIRPRFRVPSYRDVPAFHEAFADIIALLHHFSYRNVVHAALRGSGGKLSRATMLLELAREFGKAIDDSQPALRTAIDLDEEGGLLIYDDAKANAHELGKVLTRAVFDAFITIYKRRTERYLRLVRPPGGEIRLTAELREILADEASKLAGQFLSMVIRAIDYCPPIDIHFGEFLRAVITADRDLVPDDPLAYREAWIEAFRRRRIFVDHVPNLSEDALSWQPPSRPVTVPRLAFDQLRFDGDPGNPAGPEEIHSQARALGEAMTRPGYHRAFGIAAADDDLGGDRVEPPIIESVRSARRVGPDRQVQFDLVAEITQVRHVRRRGSRKGFPFLGGSTVVIDPDGRVRYAIVKHITATKRIERQRHAIVEPELAAFWEERDGRYVPAAQPFALLHDCG